MSDEHKTRGTQKREHLIHDGICPVCGDEFTDGFDRMEDLVGESIEGVRVCVVSHPDEALMHLPEDQS